MGIETFYVDGVWIGRQLSRKPYRFEMSLMGYTASTYHQALSWAEEERYKVLTCLCEGRRCYCIETYLEGDSQGGLLVAIYEETMVDCGACLRGECDKASTQHYVNGYIRS